MAKEPLQDKELQIKKTARRRLVGAIAMVVILLIILPFILKGQATDSAQDPVKITIVNEGVNSEPIPEMEDAGQGFESTINPTDVSGYTQPTVFPSQHDESASASDNKTQAASPQSTPAITTQTDLSAQTNSKDSPPLNVAQSAETHQSAVKSVETDVNHNNQEKPKNIADKSAQMAQQEKEALLKKQQEQEKLAQENAKQEKIKAEKEKLEKAKSDQAKEGQAKQERNKQEKTDLATKSSAGKFYVQYGVFSDPKNLEKLQTNLKQKGFVAETDNVDATGKKIRLRSQTYATKEEALKALSTVQASDFTAIVTGK